MNCSRKTLEPNGLFFKKTPELKNRHSLSVASNLFSFPTRADERYT